MQQLTGLRRPPRHQRSTKESPHMDVKSGTLALKKPPPPPPDIFDHTRAPHGGRRSLVCISPYPKNPPSCCGSSPPWSWGIPCVTACRGSQRASCPSQDPERYHKKHEINNNKNTTRTSEKPAEKERSGTGDGGEGRGRVSISHCATSRPRCGVKRGLPPTSHLTPCAGRVKGKLLGRSTYDL